MPAQFGTSGLRGLVTELTADCVADHVQAFARACPMGAGLYVAHDLRPSSPDVTRMVMDAGHAAGLQVTMCGPVPTPALALAAMGAGAAAVMVTGSHIPADRNGLKFYTPDGEITKAHESAIVSALGDVMDGPAGPAIVRDDTVAEAYITRYTSAFGPALTGMRIGFYAHSAVGRNLMVHMLERLGAQVVTFGWSETFIPVDTEAVAPSLRDQLKVWAATHDCDAIVSTDGDGDRPLVTDADGVVVVGDVLGQITAAVLGAQVVVTPVSSNTGVNVGDRFAQVIRTKIGSPHVIAGMEHAHGRVVGYEANGGFLLGFAADGPAGRLPALMTRDAALPIIAALLAGRERGLAALVAAQPARFTAADRLQDVPTDRSQAFVGTLMDDAARRHQFLAKLDGIEREIDCLDGLRMILHDGRIVHLRPSGNAPELRLYVEAETTARAVATLQVGLAILAAQI